jgi:hypothetical protein
MTKNVTVQNNLTQYMNRGQVTDYVSTTNIAYIRNEMQSCNIALIRMNDANPGDQPTGNGLKGANMFTPAGWYNGTSHYTLGISANCAAGNKCKIALGTGLYDAPINTYYPTNSFVSEQWYPDQYNTNSNQQIITCHIPNPPSCPTCSPSNAIITQQDFTFADMVAKGDIQYTEFAESSQWMSERDIYDRIRQDTTVINDDSILFAFYHAQQGAFIGQLYDALYNYSRVILGVDSLDASSAQNVYTQISNFNADNTCEQNLKDVYSIYFRTIAQGNDDYTATDSATLYSIASQCPADGCEGVHYARSILSMITDYNFDDSTLCNNETYAYRKNNTNKKLTVNKRSNTAILKVAIVPNPTQQNFSINLNTITEGDYAELYDVFGRLQLIVPLTSKWNAVDCANCAKGVIMVRIKNKEGKELSKPQKVVLLK